MKTNNFYQGFESITEHFLGIENMRDELLKSKKKNAELESKIKDVKKKDKIISKQMKGIEIEKSLTRKVSYNEIKERFSMRYDFLNGHCLTSLSTAEYLFINEHEDMDYGVVFLGYIKTLEISLRQLIGLNNKKDTTLGSLIIEIERFKELNSLGKKLKELKILKIRNKAMHLEPISKTECGKIRKILIDERWLERIYFIMPEINVSEILDIDVRVEEKVGIEKIGCHVYNCYATESGVFLLSDRYFFQRYLQTKAKKIEYQGMEYFIV